MDETIIHLQDWSASANVEPWLNVRVDVETVKRLEPPKFISPSSSDEILADDELLNYQVIDSWIGKGKIFDAKKTPPDAEEYICRSSNLSGGNMGELRQMLKQLNKRMEKD